MLSTTKWKKSEYERRRLRKTRDDNNGHTHALPLCAWPNKIIRQYLSY
jgi:hypothetical protein